MSSPQLLFKKTLVQLNGEKQFVVSRRVNCLTGRFWFYKKQAMQFLTLLKIKTFIKLHNNDI